MLTRKSIIQSKVDKNIDFILSNKYFKCSRTIDWKQQFKGKFCFMILIPFILIIHRSVWSIPVTIGCFICLIPLAVAIVIVLSLIPIYINRQTVQKTSTANSKYFLFISYFNQIWIARPLYASYAVQSGDVSSVNNLNNIDQTRTTQSVNYLNEIFN